MSGTERDAPVDDPGDEWVIEEGVRCVVAPCCAFTFDAGHTDTEGGGYSCPACAEIRLLAEVAALRTERDAWKRDADDLRRQVGEASALITSLRIERDEAVRLLRQFEAINGPSDEGDAFTACRAFLARVSTEETTSVRAERVESNRTFGTEETSDE